MAKIMYQPQKTEVKKTRMFHFLTYIAEKYDQSIQDYATLHHWSVQNLAQFWSELAQFCQVKFSREADEIFVAHELMQQSQWFVGAKLNFAENLLSRYDDHPAIIFNNEQDQRRTYTYHMLYDDVSKLARYFRQIGVNKNDRIAAVLPNMPETVIAMLATTSLGAIWSSCSPDFGNQGLLDRFAQIKPKILLICDGYFYNGKFFSCQSKIQWLQDNLPSIEKIILIKNAGDAFAFNGIMFDEILTQPPTTIQFEQLPFDHPVYIMYSSGTTGIPKCIVHGAGGTLLQHLKELVLHTNLSSQDKIFYYTTCGWMMWNWYVSSLAVGATIAQYEGAALYPTASRLFDFIAAEKITIFGTSAKYISSIEKNNLIPKKNYDLTALRTILSTGSPLVPRNYEYVYQDIKKDISLASISGGTDIISCFALGNPMLPVYQGELQCIGLGMDVKIYDENANAIINQKGELVCTEPFPSMPIYFWDDPQGKKYHAAYFEKYPNVWTHGDYAEITDRGTMVIYGRSDATLNPGGIRIGTAEIYRQIEKIPEIIDSLAVSQNWEDDNRIILFVILKKDTLLTNELIDKIKRQIRENCSPRHVPAKIIGVPDIPRTLSGKTIELAVRETIHGREVKNISAIANPESLKFFKHLDELM